MSIERSCRQPVTSEVIAVLRQHLASILDDLRGFYPEISQIQITGTDDGYLSVMAYDADGFLVNNVIDCFSLRNGVACYMNPNGEACLIEEEGTAYENS